MISIVLIGIEKASNLGMIARALKNFGLKELILIDPKVKASDKDAIKYAKHALDVLKNAKVKKLSFLKNFDYLIATTAMLGTDYNIPRSPLSPEKVFSKKEVYKSKTAVLFGPEGHGLSNKIVMMCDFVMTIPSSKNYPTLNISNAASIIFYEISKNHDIEKVNDHIVFASDLDKRIILQKVDNILDRMSFPVESKKETQRLLWKRMIGKAYLTRREAFALLGFLKKVDENRKT